MKATNYIRKVKKIDFIHARQYLERIGWKVVLFNTPSGDDLIHKLGLEDLAKHSSGFVYDVGLLKYVFINGEISERDKIIVTLHETGHIFLKQDLSVHDKVNELDAWKFAADVFYHKRILAKRLVACIVCAALTLGAHSAFLNAEKTIDETNVYVTSSGHKYHTANCHYIKGKQTTKLEKAEAEVTYEPCKICIGEN